MVNDYVRESRRLDALAQAMSAIADEFEKTKKANVAVAGMVLCEMILSQLDALDTALDKAIEQAKI